MAPIAEIRWPEPGPPPTPVERVLAALDEFACDPEASTELVGLAAGVSSRRVKAIMAAADTTFTAELLGRRMARARKLLSGTNFAISKVARLCGYRCPSTFAKRFASQHHGLKPREFRVARGGSRRSGGTTGAFRKPAQRARAKQEGMPAPGMRRERSLPGSMDVLLAEWENERRRARLRGETTSRAPLRRGIDSYRYEPLSDAEAIEYLAAFEDDWYAEDRLEEE